jgi:hypothetical protein
MTSVAITAYQASVTASAVKICDVPPGASSVTLTVGAASTTIVYIGTSANVTTANGAPIVGGQSVTLTTFVGSKGVTLYGIGSVAGPTPVGAFISTAQ